MAYIPLLKLKKTLAKSRLGLLVAAVCAAGAAHGAGGDPLPFIGTWVFQDGAIAVTCLSPAMPALSLPTAGVRVVVRPGTDSDLVFDMGCNCLLKLNVTAAGTAELMGSQQNCGLMVDGEEVTGVVQQWSLAASESGFSVTLGGIDTLKGTFMCDPLQAVFAGAGTIVPSATPAIACGDDDTAVGVIPYGPEGAPHCQLGAGMEEVEIIMRDEITSPCTAEPGASGEGRWALPDDMRPRRLDCAAAGPGAPLTDLRFCRVDGRLFNPMTSDADPSQYFAVLKLGTRCPDGSVEISKIIDNEDEPVAGVSSVPFGRLGPNTTGNEHGYTDTTLYFCFFQQGAAPATAFPELGFRYDVFHQYSGEQPPWVIAKSWLYSDDEDDGGQNQYVPSSDPITTEFKQLIEDLEGNNTFFDLAWVR
jgi:hypothetical protein